MLPMMTLSTPTVQVVAPETFGATAAEHIAATLRVKPDAVLGLPTGNTPVPVYAALLARRDVNFSRARVAMLDEYLGAGDRPISFYQWLRSHFLAAAAIAPERILRMPSDPEGIAAACAAYDRQLEQWGGCDLQLLGLGLNGHIGFNEPGSSGDSATRVVPLSASTRNANEEYWQGEEVPEFGVTTGIGVILRAKRIILLVNGARKAATLRQALDGPIGPDCPASFLRRHRDVLVLADRAAAGQD
jgi:glucosamine-6-phosphate deaminase